MDSTLFERLCRLVDAKSYHYRSAKELRRSQSNDVVRYYEAVPTPNRPEVRDRFLTIGFETSVRHVVACWQAAWTDLQDANRLQDAPMAGKLPEVLRNWNLDTGADQDLPDPRITFWKLPPATA
jgi:hypothetical protein